MIRLLKTLLIAGILSFSSGSYGNDADTQAALDKEITTKKLQLFFMSGKLMN